MIYTVICHGVFFMPNDSILRLPSRASFSDFAGKYSKEERFKGIEKMREREAVFNDFVSEVRRKEKEESRSLKEKVCLLVVASERLGCVFGMSGHVMTMPIVIYAYSRECICAYRMMSG